MFSVLRLFYYSFVLLLSVSFLSAHFAQGFLKSLIANEPLFPIISIIAKKFSFFKCFLINFYVKFPVFMP